jgi:hypothetical protein
LVPPHEVIRGKGIQLQALLPSVVVQQIELLFETSEVLLSNPKTDTSCCNSAFLYSPRQTVGYSFQIGPALFSFTTFQFIFNYCRISVVVDKTALNRSVNEMKVLTAVRREIGVLWDATLCRMVGDRDIRML